MSGEKKDAGTAKTPARTRLTLLVAVVLVVIGVSLIWIVSVASRPSLTALAAFIGLVGVYPFAYLAYLGFSANAQRERLRDDFRLLGLVKEEELKSTVEKLYQTVYSPVQFVIFIGLILIVSLLMLYGYFNRQVLSSILAPETMALIFYSFLGAYVFSVQELIRRYNTFDLQPQVYSSILVRMLVAMLTTFVGAAVITLSGGQLAAADGGPGGDPQAWAAVLAFLIGIFPSSGLRWFSQQASRVLTVSPSPGSELPMRDLLGISAWHEARLSQMGIDDAQNLATADIRRLLLTTQFDTQQIVNWIDQAILSVKVGSKLERYRDAKITTFHELRLLLNNLSLDPRLNLKPEEQRRRTEARNRLAAALGVSDADELERVGDHANFLNYSYIAEYYSRTALVARQRASVGMDLLIGALEETDFDGAIEAGEPLRIQNPNDPELYNRLGSAYYQRSLQVGNLSRADDLQRAFDYYSEAIRLDPGFSMAYHNRSLIYLARGDYESSIKDCTSAINVDHRNPEAFNNRGLAYMKMRYFDRALEDLDEALRLDDRLGVAYLNRGVAYNAQSKFELAVKDFERAFLLDERQSELWISWGNALIGMARFEDAVDKLSQAVLFEDSSGAAYAKRGYAYMQLGAEYFHQAQMDLEAAIRKNDQLLDAHINLGLLKAQLKKYDEAIQHYQKVLQADNPQFEIITRFNLALALDQRGRKADARKEFEVIISKAPADSPEVLAARQYLAQSNVAGSPAP